MMANVLLFLFFINDKGLWKCILSQFSIYFQKESLLAIIFQKITIVQLRRLTKL